jgi:hypothetical protein
LGAAITGRALGATAHRFGGLFCRFRPVFPGTNGERIGPSALTKSKAFSKKAPVDRPQ